MGVQISGAPNRNSRFAIGGIGAILLGFFLTCWANTQYLAYSFGFQRALGKELFKIGSWKIYQPFSWWSWHWKFSVIEGKVQDILSEGAVLVAAGCCLSVGAGVYVWYRRSLKTSEVKGLHGTARFAEIADVEKMQLITGADDGIYLGIFEYKGKQYFLRYNGDAHTLVFAPTRSGKGVGLVLPTLLSYRHSVLVHDLKKENFMLSAGFRHSAGQLVICFEPTQTLERSIDGETLYKPGCSWNPLDEIRKFTEFDVMDAQNLAAAIADPDGEGMDDHWVSTSYAFLTGLILHMLYAEDDKTLAGASIYMSDPSFSDEEQMYQRMLNSEHDPDGVMGWTDSMGQPTKTHPQVALAAQTMLNKEERERGSVLSTAKSKLELYSEPIVARNTRSSDFSVKDIMNHDKPVSLYIVVPPTDKERLRPITRLLVSFLLRRLAGDMRYANGRSVKSYKHRLQLLIDEFPALKKMEAVEEGLAFLAGYGINAFLFTQDVIQLRKEYEENETVSGGCHIKVAYAPNTDDTAELMSKMCGTTTVEFEEVSYSGTRIGSMLGQMNVSKQRQERPLMTPDEIRTMGPDDSLIFVTNQPAIRAKKIRYYNVPIFQERAKIAPPVRIGYQLSESGETSKNWAMVSVVRTSNPNILKLTANVHQDWWNVKVSVKQLDADSKVVQVFDCMLSDSNSRSVSSFEIAEHQYEIAVVGRNFVSKDEFEVHFEIDTSKSGSEYCGEGFYRVPSVFYAEALSATEKTLQEEGVEYFIEDVWPNKAYVGFVWKTFGNYLILRRTVGSLSIVSLHRKSALSKVPGPDVKVRIKYQGSIGNVM